MANQVSSITDVVKQMAQQQQTKASEAEKSQTVQIQFQTKANELQTDLRSVLLETKAVEKVISHEEDTIENLIRLCGILKAQNHSIYSESIRLKLNLETQKEDFEAILSRNNAYHAKIEDNIRCLLEAENTLPVMTELINKRDVLRMLRRQKEKMIQDLHNPESIAIKQVQEEMANLEEKLKEVKQCITLKNKVYEEEKERHIELQKEIEVQKKRFDAILKRLHSQINKVKMNRRHYQWQIDQMETQAMNLRQKLETMKF
ncbi:hypothetical protein XENTR_v10006532 [Xenopus tropicalis]|uniref:Coiled-coil domain-containing 122 n=1 Tax=Xenopus tropicalis TaxID=8364 RepID=A0A6I8R9N2_XENTR|nr:coiled-coil domain-containing protein 122 [Xenopus tropicalis]KAE8626171.1 hypothetical protein XENTR_v10006532 [Xenopus tropicalis]